MPTPDPFPLLDCLFLPVSLKRFHVRGEKGRGRTVCVGRTTSRYRSVGEDGRTGLRPSSSSQRCPLSVPVPTVHPSEIFRTNRGNGTHTNVVHTHYCVCHTPTYNVPRTIETPHTRTCGHVPYIHNTTPKQVSYFVVEGEVLPS